MAKGIRVYKDLLSEIFPQFKQVRKVSLNAGFSCPSSCAYCNNGSFSSVATTKQPLLEQLENGIKQIRRKNKEIGVLAYFQSYTNTYAPVEKLRKIFMPIISRGDIAGIAVGTRPDCLQPPVVELLAEMNKIKPVIVEIGVQTANNQTLKNINRNHTAECAKNAAELCKNSGLCTTAHIIIGLPGENINDFANTAKFVKNCGFSSVKIHPLHIVKETRFAKEYENGKIELISLEDYCKAVAEIIHIVSPNVAIERVSAETSAGMLIAPAWSCDRLKIWSLVFGYSGSADSYCSTDSTDSTSSACSTGSTADSI